MTQPIGDAQGSARRDDGDEPPRTVVEVDATSVLRVVVVALLAAGAYAVFQQAPSMLTKIIVGVVLALALDPVVVKVQDRFGWRRGFAVLLVGSLLTVAFFAVLVVLGPAAIDEASKLRDDLPETIEDMYSWPIVGERLERADAANEVNRAIDSLPTNLDNAALTRYAEDILGGVVTLVVVLVTALSLMLDGPGLIDRIRRVVPRDRRAQAEGIGRIVYSTFGNYFAGSLFVAILNGLVLLTISLVLGIPLAPLIAVWASLTNLIPQIGGFLGGSFLVVLALTQGPVTAVIALAVFLGYQQIENNVIQPAVVGKAVDLTPPATMLAALIGGAVAGVPGALVATPIVGSAKALYLRDTADGSFDGKGLEAETRSDHADDQRPL